MQKGWKGDKEEKKKSEEEPSCSFRCVVLFYTPQE